MANVVSLPHTGVDIQLELPDQECNTVLILLPGISGDVFGARYQKLADKCAALSIALCRVEIWKNADDAGSMTFDHIHKALNEVVGYLKEKDFVHFIGVGKSFGGGVLLSYPGLSTFSKVVLWAPAIGVAETQSTFAELRSLKLRDMASLLLVTLDKDMLVNSTRDTEVCIIHGSRDSVIPLSNSEMLIGHISRAILHVVDGMDHSAKTPEQEDSLLEETYRFFSHTY